MPSYAAVTAQACTISRRLAGPTTFASHMRRSSASSELSETTVTEADFHCRRKSCSIALQNASQSLSFTTRPNQSSNGPGPASVPSSLTSDGVLRQRKPTVSPATSRGNGDPTSNCRASTRNQEASAPDDVEAVPDATDSSCRKTESSSRRKRSASRDSLA